MDVTKDVTALTTRLSPAGSSAGWSAPRREVVFAITVSLVLYSIAWPTFGLTHTAPTALWPVLTAVGVLPLMLSPFRPAWAWALIVAACIAVTPLHSAPDFFLSWPVTFHIALGVAVLWALTCEPPAVAVGISVATATLMGLNPGVEAKIVWSVIVAALCAFALLLRLLTASRRQLARSAASLERESARSAEQSGLRVAAEERTRLARDLHDVVAHQMSMIVVQAQSAPYRLQGVTPAIHAEFDSLANTAREALDEVRGLLGVLRTDAEQSATGAAATTPVGADQLLPTLYGARRSGVDLAWTVTGDVTAMDDTAGVVLHRVLQESLSNATRHAPGAQVLVTLEVPGLRPGEAAADPAAEQVRLEVTNGPAAAGALPSPESTGGSGIQGMAARVTAVGGTFSALPEADGGFTVTARVPLRRRR